MTIPAWCAPVNATAASGAGPVDAAESSAGGQHARGTRADEPEQPPAGEPGPGAVVLALAHRPATTAATLLTDSVSAVMLSLRACSAVWSSWS